MHQHPHIRHAVDVFGVDFDVVDRRGVAEVGDRLDGHRSVESVELFARDEFTGIDPILAIGRPDGMQRRDFERGAIAEVEPQQIADIARDKTARRCPKVLDYRSMLCK